MIRRASTKSNLTAVSTHSRAVRVGHRTAHALQLKDACGSSMSNYSNSYPFGWCPHKKKENVNGAMGGALCVIGLETVNFDRKHWKKTSFSSEKKTAFLSVCIKFKQKISRFFSKNWILTALRGNFLQVTQEIFLRNKNLNSCVTLDVNY